MVKKHCVKPTPLDFKRLNEKAEANNLMKNTAIKLRKPSTQYLSQKLHLRHLLLIRNKRFLKNCCRALRQHLNHAASYARAFIGCGSVVCLRKKTPTQRAKVVAKAKLCFSCLRENTFLGNAKVPVNVE